VGWGAGTWGSPPPAGGTIGTWGYGLTSTSALRLWNQINYGQDLVYGPRTGPIYYWEANDGVNTRGVLLNSLGGTVSFTNASPTVVTSTILYTEGAALQFSGGSLPTGVTAATTYYVFQVDGLTFNLLDGSGNEVNTASSGTGTVSLIVDCPTVQNNMTVSDASRFLLAFGCNDYGSNVLDPMLIRWSNQDDIFNWTPDPTNQAGFTRLSHGSEIVATVQTRQEIVMFTDSAIYSLQYLGPPYVWVPQLLGDNISIMSPNSAVIASGIVYWMGVDKFYSYDGRVNTLNCDLRCLVTLTKSNHCKYLQGQTRALMRSGGSIAQPARRLSTGMSSITIWKKYGTTAPCLELLGLTLVCSLFLLRQTTLRLR
jgi:hypothetical protein